MGTLQVRVPETVKERKVRIVIGSDHAGFHLRQRLTQWLTKRGYEVENVGPTTPEDVDYPLVAQEVGRRMRGAADTRGVLICGSGVGMSMAANKLPGIRAVLAHEVYSAHQGVEHDDANVICLGGQVVGPWLAEDLVASFLAAKFEPREDFVRRVRQMDEFDRELAAAPQK
jgi:ribose 5-phosphate isomerase B